MIPALFMPLAGGPGLILSPNTLNITGSKFSGTGHAGIEFRSDGTEFKTPINGNSGYTVDLGKWIDVGAPGDVWIQRTITGGSLGSFNSEDAGSGRLRLNVTRAFRIERASLGSDNLTCTFDFFDAASGGNNLYSFSRTFTASYTL